MTSAPSRVAGVAAGSAGRRPAATPAARSDPALPHPRSRRFQRRSRAKTSMSSATGCQARRARTSRKAGSRLPGNGLQARSGQRRRQARRTGRALRGPASPDPQVGLPGPPRANAALARVFVRAARGSRWGRAATISSEASICAGVPSRTGGQPRLNKVSPQNTSHRRRWPTGCACGPGVRARGMPTARGPARRPSRTRWVAIGTCGSAGANTGNRATGRADRDAADMVRMVVSDQDRVRWRASSSAASTGTASPGSTMTARPRRRAAARCSCRRGGNRLQAHLSSRDGRGLSRRIRPCPRRFPPSTRCRAAAASWFGRDAGLAFAGQRGRCPAAGDPVLSGRPACGWPRCPPAGRDPGSSSCMRPSAAWRATCGPACRCRWAASPAGVVVVQHLADLACDPGLLLEECARCWSRAGACGCLPSIRCRRTGCAGGAGPLRFEPVTGAGACARSGPARAGLAGLGRPGTVALDPAMRDGAGLRAAFLLLTRSMPMTPWRARRDSAGRWNSNA